MAPLSSLAVSTAAIIIAVVVLLTAQTGAATWCVARSDASDQALQTALDYACWAGADCAPILTNGLCFLPNTLIAHASYAFDSYFQRKNMAPGSCDFSGTATVAKTDPSLYSLSTFSLCLFWCFLFLGCSFSIYTTSQYLSLTQYGS